MALFTLEKVVPGVSKMSRFVVESRYDKLATITDQLKLKFPGDPKPIERLTPNKTVTWTWAESPIADIPGYYDPTVRAVVWHLEYVEATFRIPLKVRLVDE